MNEISNEALKRFTLTENSNDIPVRYIRMMASELLKFRKTAEAAKCKHCGDTGYFVCGFSGRDDDGNAPILERCDCDVGLGLKTIQITEYESLKADAERYRFLRNADLSVMNLPCIAVQHTEKNGTFLSGDDADKALNEAMWTRRHHAINVALKLPLD